jgi:hypothetical protein
MKTLRKAVIGNMHRYGLVRARTAITMVRGIERGCSGPVATIVWLMVWPAMFL